jgi:hypothetical protein
LWPLYSLYKLELGGALGGQAAPIAGVGVLAALVVFGN